MESVRSFPSQVGHRLSFTTENHHSSSVGYEQKAWSCCKSGTKLYSANEKATCDTRTSGHSRSIMSKVVLEQLSTAVNSQRCYMSRKFWNGTDRTFRLSFSVYLWNYVMIILSLLVMSARINSSASYDDLCRNVTWSSDAKCNCSMNTLSNLSCEEIPLEQNETLYSCHCGNNMMCSISVTYAYGNQVIGNCSCEDGYAGWNCETFLVNNCENGTCLNGGTCMELTSNSSYSCQCSAGFSGMHCEYDIDICNETDFCQNNGSCINNGFGGYICNCTEGYEGFNCSLPNCTQIECANGGTCDVVNDVWICNCTEGFEGLKCEKDVDECSSLESCLNNSTCNNTEGSYQCLCTSGFTGHRCESDINECNSPNICLNNATCNNFEGGYHCDCADGYIGANCSAFDGCLSNPCMRNGSCNRVNDTYYNCTCLPGFMGLHCEKFDRCASSPCLHGSCSNEDDSYKCSCSSEYTGIHCNITNSCFIHRCENGGSCIDLLQNASDSSGNCSIPGNCFSCRCTANFTGSFCEELISVPDEDEDSDSQIGLIIGLIVGLFFLVLIIVGIILIIVVLNKRKNLGTYHPSRQEVSNARLEINGGLKPPPEERLI